MGTFRFVLAINVALFHLLKVPVIGPYAVYSFFILSGFLMTTIMHKTYKYSFVGFFAYVTNRFLRIYPLYWALLIPTLAVIWLVGADFIGDYNSAFNMPSNWRSWVKNISLFYTSFEPIKDTPRLSPSSWALTIELFFYLLIGIGISKTRTITLVWFFASFSYWIFMHLTQYEFSGGYGNVLSASLPFSLGAILFFYKDNIYSHCRLYHQSLSITIICAFIINLVTASMITEFYASLVCLYFNMIFSALIILNLAKIKLTTEKRRLDRFLGDLSYPIYIFHWAGGALASWAIYQKPIRESSLFALPVFVLAITATVIVALVMNTYITKIADNGREKVKNLIFRNS